MELLAGVLKICPSLRGKSNASIYCSLTTVSERAREILAANDLDPGKKSLCHNDNDDLLTTMV